MKIHFTTRDELITEDKELAGMDVRLQLLDDGSINLHFGDSQFDTNHQGYWGDKQKRAKQCQWFNFY